MRAARGAEGQKGSRVLLRREGGIKRGPREKSEAESRGKTSPRSKKTRSGGQSEPLDPACCPPYQDWPERFASPLFPPPHRSPFSNHGVRLRPEITESRSPRNCGLCGSQTENPRYWTPPPEPPPSASTSHTIKRNQTVRNPRGEKEKIRIKIPPVPENPN